MQADSHLFKQTDAWLINQWQTNADRLKTVLRILPKCEKRDRAESYPCMYIYYKDMKCQNVRLFRLCWYTPFVTWKVTMLFKTVFKNVIDLKS